MNPAVRFLGYLLFWIMLGLLVAIGVMLVRGDMVLSNGEDEPRQAVTPPPPSQVIHQTTVQQKSFAEAVNIAAPAVVNVHAVSTVDVPDNIKLLERFLGKNLPRPEPRNERTTGSGVVMDSDGYILTNYHVIANAEKVGVVLADGRSVLADIVGNDPDTDLAVLKIELDGLPAIQPSNMDSLRIGDIALAIGYPSRIGLSVTQGIISATGRNRISDTPYQNYIQTDAAINPGNSGGALVNSDGELIGINTLQSATFQGIGFAIPVDLATSVYRQIRKNGHVVRGWIGLEGAPVSPSQLKNFPVDFGFGILITTAVETGPGFNAGIREGDIITHIGDKRLKSITEIMETVAASTPGDTMVLKGIRKTESFVAEVVLGQRPLQSQ